MKKTYIKPQTEVNRTIIMYRFMESSNIPIEEGGGGFDTHDELEPWEIEWSNEPKNYWWIISSQ